MSDIDHHQISHRTAYDRYPHVFRLASKSISEETLPQNVKVLSYGCSTGEEAHCLATMYFTEATIIGLDVTQDVLDLAKSRYRHDRIVYDTSTDDSLAKYGPFDCIAAMSVLCRWPDSENIADISEIYPFSRFEEAVVKLDSHLKRGGVLVVFNSNFNFLDTSVAARYKVIPIATSQHNGFVHRFDITNKRITNYSANDCIYRKL